MKFVDETTIRVIAGKGGNGCLSFLREKHRPKGGPDGGNGGDGGSVYMVGDEGLNTLADFRYVRVYKAKSGSGGSGRCQSGKNGADLLLTVPLGTVVADADTGEFIGDVTHKSDLLLVARGGRRGLGNAHFKSSTNRTPRRTTVGQAGDERSLLLELKVLADVGLLGLPNAGKSTFLSRVSHARPKIADYPFTTLIPQLGVVDIGPSSSFVVADIPGLIEGAACGAGLGIQFLKHLERTRILLHLVDVIPPDDRDIVSSIREIEAELERFSPVLYQNERWLVLNKIDTIPSARVRSLSRELAEHLDGPRPVHAISSVTGEGCRELSERLMKRLTGISRHDEIGVSAET